MINRKGIILAGGAGSRLYPATLAISKQLLPIYDKPMIYYPLSTLMQAGIRDILIITTPDDASRFTQLLHTGCQWGINLQYAQQPRPEGIAQAFLIARQFLQNLPCALILGDNLFHGHNLTCMLNTAGQKTEGASIFAHYTTEPERYGVIEFDQNNRPIRLHEKPSQSYSHYAVTGLYMYDNNVINIVQNICPSQRGELEITDVNNSYLMQNQLNVFTLDHEFVWLDAGTPQSMLEANQYVHMVEAHTGLKIGCPEEIAFKQGWIDQQQLERLSIAYGNQNPYGQYLKSILHMTNKP